MIPQIGISRASCDIAGNHHQFRFKNPPQVSSKSTPHVVIVELVFHPTVFCTIIDFLLFLRSMILAWLGNNCLDYLSVYQKLNERSFRPPSPPWCSLFLDKSKLVLYWCHAVIRMSDGIFSTHWYCYWYPFIWGNSIKMKQSGTFLAVYHQIISTYSTKRI